MPNLPLDTPLFEFLWPTGEHWVIRLNGQVDGISENVKLVNHALPLINAIEGWAVEQASKESSELMYQALQEAEITDSASDESAPLSTSMFPEPLHLKPWTRPDGDAKPPLRLLQTVGGRILVTHLELLRCTQLGMQLPTWSDLDSLLHPTDPA